MKLTDEERYFAETVIGAIDHVNGHRKRGGVMDLTDRTLIAEMVDAYGNVHWDDIKKLPSAQTGWTGIEDDYPVSVKAVLNITAETGALETQRRVRKLPPMQKTGKWVATDKGLKVTIYECSECGRHVMDDTGYDVAKDYPYCHCGQE